MKKGVLIFVVVALVCVTIIFSFMILGVSLYLFNNNTDSNLDNGEIVTEQQQTDVNGEDTLTVKDFYLYKTVYNNGYYGIYRPDGQIECILEYDGMTRFAYDDDGLLESIEDPSLGYARFQYEFVDGYYYGTAHVGDGTYLKRVYDENYRLIRMEEGDEVYEYIYRDTGILEMTVETNCGWHKGITYYDENGIISEVIYYNEEDEIVEKEEYDSLGRLIAHEYMEYGIVTRYSEFKQEGNKYIEYICDVNNNDEEYVEREYDEYGNLLSENYQRWDDIVYEYKLK